LSQRLHNHIKHESPPNIHQPGQNTIKKTAFPAGLNMTMATSSVQRLFHLAAILDCRSRRDPRRETLASEQTMLVLALKESFVEATAMASNAARATPMAEDSPDQRTRQRAVSAARSLCNA
jgi:hypothetical protein